MAVIKAINSKSSVSSVINYVADKDKTSEALMYGKDCSSNPNQAIEDMKMTKELYNKEDGRQYKHFVQSFDLKDNITPEKANQIGREWAEKNFKGYEVFIATHKDKDHIHNHFVVNSVNFEDGRKLVYDNKQLAEFKKVNDLICEREGLYITEPKKDILTSFNMQKYKALEKGVEGGYRSYMLDLWKNVNSSMKKATSKEQFIQSMNQKGYEVKWSDSRKYITYVPQKGRPIRDSNLVKTFKNDKFSKEGLVNEFSRNGERLRDRGKESINTGAGGIVKGDNQQIVRYRSNIEESIFFSTNGESKVSSIGNDKSVSINKTEQRETGEVNRAVGGREESTRGEQKTEYRENQQDTSWVKGRNEGIKRNELSEDRGNNQSSAEVTRDNRRDIHEVSGDITRSQQHGESDNMERESKTILNSTSDNNRIDIDDNRCLSSNDLLEQIVESFAEPLKREEERKMLAELEEKAREKQKLQFEQKSRFRNKSKDFGPEL